MPVPTESLQRLISHLDSLGSKRTLIDLADALAGSNLQYADVEPYVRTTEHSYTRNTVALRDNYELLVLTWQGGQASVPHDHGGSICAMLTMRGIAVEGNYSVAPDGYVDLEFEQQFTAGQITAGDDAAVHTVRNCATDKSDLLVTVHIYAPPLRDFRRFVERPSSIPNPAGSAPAEVSTVAIIGGGFSGSMCATQLIRQASAAGQSLRILLVEQRGSLGEGLAYATREFCHLLNVPAGRMSAFPDQPTDFLDWAKVRNPNISADDFLPRQWYGEYIRETLMRAANSAGDPVEFSVTFDEVRRITRHPEGGWLLNLARGTPIRADAVVLAIGHRAPSDPLGRKWTGPRTRFIADPWKIFAMNAVSADDGVLILGTGLTAVDAVMSLIDRGHRGPITLVSRRGLLPQPHLPGHSTPVDATTWVKELISNGFSALSLYRMIRKQVEQAASQHIPWQAVIDGIRPHISALWQAMVVEERRRFLSHLRAFWEVHRHRMPVPVAKRFSEALGSGMVRVLRGRVESVLASGDEMSVWIRDRAGGDRLEHSCRWIVNATGPSPSNSAAANPAIGSLLIQGLLSPDELNLGVKTTGSGNPIGLNAQPISELFVVGTLRKPQLWESTAVPELRQQAAGVASEILRHVTKSPSLV